MVNKLTKADSTLVIRKMQIQTTTRYRTTHPFRRVRRRKNLTTPRADEDRANWNSHTLLGMQNGAATLENYLPVSSSLTS